MGPVSWVVATLGVWWKTEGERVRHEWKKPRYHTAECPIIPLNVCIGCGKVLELTEAHIYWRQDLPVINQNPDDERYRHDHRLCRLCVEYMARLLGISLPNPELPPVGAGGTP